jgi:peptide deformylase
LSVKELITWPDSRLRKVSEPEPGYDEGLLSDKMIALIKDLIDTMWAHKGAGLAAIQIGVPRTVFIVEGWMGGKKNDPPKVFVDPEITWVSEEIDVETEGCLSFPETFLNIKRPSRCRIKARNEEGITFEVEVGGLLARAVQHEYDHITGKIFLDWLSPLKLEMVKKKLKKKAKKRKK